MNKKIVMLLIPLLFIAVAFSSLTFALPKNLNIGIIGPVGLPQWSPGGMWDGAQLARDEINAAGGIQIGGETYMVNLMPADEASYPNILPAQAGINTQNLIDAGAKLIIGGFRTEVVAQGILPVIRLSKVPFFIDGAATASLINLTTPALYDSDKYIFRVMPTNDTALLRVVTDYIKYYLLPLKLNVIYGGDLDNNPATPNQTRVAIVAEQLNWTLAIQAALTNPAIYPQLLGPYANVSYTAIIPTTAMDTKPYLDAVEVNNCHLMITIFSAPIGNTLMYQWANQGPYHFLPVGINVMSQLQSHWITAGSEYEVTEAFSGTATDIASPKTLAFWNNFVGNYSTWPIYTAFGAYDTLYALRETLENIDPGDVAAVQDYLDGGPTPSDVLIPYFEQTDRVALNGRFQFTGGIYGAGTGHDVFSIESNVTWPLGYARPFMDQWINGTRLNLLTGGYMTVVSPRDQLYSKKTLIPPWMSVLSDYDLNFDGKVNRIDINIAQAAYGSVPGNPRWNIEADINLDDVVDMSDVGDIARHSTIYDVAVDSVTPYKTVVAHNYSMYIKMTVANHGNVPETFNVTAYANDTIIPTPEQWPNSTQMETFWSLGDVNREGHIDDNDLILVQLAFNTVPGDQCWNPDADLDLSGKVDVLDAIKISNNYGKDVWSYFGLSGTLGNQTTLTLPIQSSTNIIFTWDTTGFAKGNYTVRAYAWPVPDEIPIDIADNNCTDGTVTIAMVGDVSGDVLGVPDGKVYMDDVGVVAKHFGAVICHSPVGVWPYEPNYDIMGSVPPDFTLADYKINMADIGTVARHFGETDP